MKFKIILITLIVLISLTTKYSFATLTGGAPQAVYDHASLVQNIKNTLHTLKIEHQGLISIAQRAEEIAEHAQEVMYMERQLETMYLQMKNIQVMIKEGRYKSVSDLNSICFTIQRISYTATNIKETFKQLFPDAFGSMEEKKKLVKEQEEEIEGVIQQSLTHGTAASGRNKDTEYNIKKIIEGSNDAPGVKGAIQATNLMLAEISRQNMDIKDLLVINSRVENLAKAKAISEDKMKRDDHLNFMKDYNKKREGDGFLTSLLKDFTKVLTLGYKSLASDALVLLRYFIVIEIIFLGYMVMFTSVNIEYETIKKVILIGFYIWLIPNMQPFVLSILSSFGKAGILAGGSHLTTHDLFDPSQIVGFGFTVTDPLFKAAGDYKNIFDMIIVGLSGLTIVISYLFIAWVLFLAILEFHIITVAAVILIPFGVSGRFKDLSEKTIAATFAICIRFMFIAIVLNIGWDTLRSVGSVIQAEETGTVYKFVGSMGLVPTVSMSGCIKMVSASCMISILIVCVNKLAAIYYGGGPALGGSFLIGSATSTLKSIDSGTKNMKSRQRLRKLLNAS